MSIKKRLACMLSAFVALVAVFAIATPAFAIGSGKGSITITNATVGKTYTAYRLFDSLSTGEGVTATEAQRDAYYDLTGNPFIFTDNGTGNYIVSVADETTGEEISQFIEDNLGSLPVLGEGVERQATSSTLVFSDLDFGYYYITSGPGTEVTLTSATPDATVIDKNQTPSGLKKTVNDEDKAVEVGTPFEYTLTFQATNYAGEQEITKYTVSDTLSAGMKFASATASVTVDDGKVHELPSETIDTDSDTFSFDIDWQNENGFIYKSPATVTVKYQVVLTNSAAIETDLTNNAKVTWNGNDEGLTTQETVQTYALALMKVDEQGNALQGATFAVTKGEGESNTPVNVSLVSSENNVNVYVVSQDSTSNEVVSPKSGLIVIKGVDGSDYTLTETVAPAGYNKCDPVPIKPTKTGSTTVTIYKDADGNVTESVTENTATVTAPVNVTAKVVVDKAGSLLPSTGGMGTTALYAVGAVLVIGAGVTLVVRRRAHHEA